MEECYCKYPYNWDTLNYCCNYPKIEKDADRMANRTDPDQPVLLLQEQSDQGLHCLPRAIICGCFHRF